MTTATPLVFALPKGRILEEALPLLEQAGVVPEAAFFDKSSRALSFATSRPDVTLIRVRAFDVATFVAHGAAQAGIVGSDVIDEFDYADLYAPVDLDIGHCRLSVAEPVAGIGGEGGVRQWYHQGRGMLKHNGLHDALACARAGGASAALLGAHPVATAAGAPTASKLHAL